MIFRYTVKGHSLATEGHPQTHSALPGAKQLANRIGIDLADRGHGSRPSSKYALEPWPLGTLDRRRAWRSHRPLHTGSRFSAKAVAPSRASEDARIPRVTAA